MHSWFVLLYIIHNLSIINCLLKLLYIFTAINRWIKDKGYKKCCKLMLWCIAYVVYEHMNQRLKYMTLLWNNEICMYNQILKLAICQTKILYIWKINTAVGSYKKGYGGHNISIWPTIVLIIDLPIITWRTVNYIS